MKKNKYKNVAVSKDGSKYLKHSGDVVLNFPFKDCILEGGQSNEEGTDYNIEFDKNGDLKETNQKRKEIFFNEVIAKDAIDRLKEKKALTNGKKVTAQGNFMEGMKVAETSIDSINHTKDNLLIKGNNLLALYSLLPIYKGKVKLIYIDPPYNTGNDGFKYNDKFNHSTWLVFMKNRLEVAKELLAEDGVIFVQIDDNEQAYLKVLMDEVFGRENFVSTIPRISSFQRSGQEDYMNVSHDYLICYSYDNDFHNISERDYSVNDVLEDKNGKYIKGDTKAILAAESQGYSEGGDYDFEYNGKLYKPTSKNGKRNRWLWTKQRMQAAADLGILVETKNSLRMQIYLDKKFEEGSNKLVNKDEKLIFHTADFMKEKKYSNAVGTQELNELIPNHGFKYPKPELLLQDLIQMTTMEGDLVLDFFAGSGTTGAVAHKMNRRWIMIEQMEYIESITKVRLQKVLEGEQGGVSKNHKWQGGGSFVYLELAKWNEKAKEKIITCNSLKDLKTLFEELYEKYFLNYNINAKLFLEGQNSQAIIDKDEFKALGLEKQKEIFCKMLDVNQMYVLASEVEDKIYELSEEDIALTKTFYSI